MGCPRGGQVGPIEIHFQFMACETAGSIEW